MGRTERRELQSELRSAQRIGLEVADLPLKFWSRAKTSNSVLNGHMATIPILRAARQLRQGPHTSRSMACRRR